MALHINNHIKQQDNSIRMLSIQKSLGGSLAPNLITPGRVFIKDGPLKKVNNTSARAPPPLRPTVLYCDYVHF